MGRRNWAADRRQRPEVLRNFARCLGSLVDSVVAGTVADRRTVAAHHIGLAIVGPSTGHVDHSRCRRIVERAHRRTGSADRRKTVVPGTGIGPEEDPAAGRSRFPEEEHRSPTARRSPGPDRTGGTADCCCCYPSRTC